MKICFLSISFNDGYGGQHMYALTKGLVEKGIDVTAIVPSSKNSKSFEVKDGVKIHRFRYFIPKKYQELTSGGGILTQFKNSLIAKLQFPFFLLFFVFKTLKVAKKSNLIHANWTLTGIPGVIAKKIYKKKMILSLHGGGIRYVPAFLNRWITKNSDAIISGSPEQNEILRSIGWKGKIYNIKNISDAEKFETKVEPERIKEFKSQFNLGEDPVVTFMARFEPIKDPMNLAKAVPLVLKENPNVKFMIIGGGSLFKDLVSFVRKNNLEKNVQVLDKRDDTEVLLQSSTIFCGLSPITNVFSGSIREALMSRLPCIVTKPISKAGKVYESYYYRHEEYAYLIPAKNPRALADAILKLLREKKLRKKLSNNAHRFLKEFGFLKDIVVKQSIDLYNYCIDPNQYPMEKHSVRPDLVE